MGEVRGSEGRTDGRTEAFQVRSGSQSRLNNLQMTCTCQLTYNSCKMFCLAWVSRWVAEVVRSIELIEIAIHTGGPAYMQDMDEAEEWTRPRNRAEQEDLLDQPQQVLIKSLLGLWTGIPYSLPLSQVVFPIREEIGVTVKRSLLLQSVCEIKWKRIKSLKATERGKRGLIS